MSPYRSFLVKRKIILEKLSEKRWIFKKQEVETLRAKSLKLGCKVEGNDFFDFPYQVQDLLDFKE